MVPSSIQRTTRIGRKLHKPGSRIPRLAHVCGSNTISNKLENLQPVSAGWPFGMADSMEFGSKVSAKAKVVWLLHSTFTFVVFFDVFEGHFLYIIIFWGCQGVQGHGNRSIVILNLKYNKFITFHNIHFSDFGASLQEAAQHRRLDKPWSLSSWLLAAVRSSRRLRSSCNGGVTQDVSDSVSAGTWLSKCELQKSRHDTPRSELRSRWWCLWCHQAPHPPDRVGVCSPSDLRQPVVWRSGCWMPDEDSCSRVIPKKETNRSWMSHWCFVTDTLFQQTSHPLWRFPSTAHPTSESALEPFESIACPTSSSMVALTWTGTSCMKSASHKCTTWGHEAPCSAVFRCVPQNICQSLWDLTSYNSIQQHTELAHPNSHSKWLGSNAWAKSGLIMSSCLRNHESLDDSIWATWVWPKMGYTPNRTHLTGN